MIYLFSAAVPLLGIMLYEIFIAKKKNSAWIYIILFAILSFGSYLLDHCLHASEIDIYECSLTEEDKEKYWKLIQYHWAMSYNNSLSSRDWLKTLQDKLDEDNYGINNTALVAISTAAVAKDLKVTAIASTISMINENLKIFAKVCAEIRIQLLSAKYHVEMAEFYQDVLNNEGAL